MHRTSRRSACKHSLLCNCCASQDIPLILSAVPARPASEMQAKIRGASWRRSQNCWRYIPGDPGNMSGQITTAWQYMPPAWTQASFCPDQLVEAGHSGKVKHLRFPLLLARQTPNGNYVQHYWQGRFLPDSIEL